MAVWTEVQVRDRLRSLCPPDAIPELTPADLDEMVWAAKLADIEGNPPDDFQPWPGAGVSLAVGALAVPTDRNGYVYRVQSISGDGRTGATEPVWAGSTVTDNEVTWQPYATAPWTPTWSVNAGAARGWRIKAGRAAEDFSFSAGTDRFDVNQLLEHCLRMAKVYEGSGVAVLSASGRHSVRKWAGVLGN